jgi:predicted ABC-type exoprotein transport system permease subunit
MTIKSILPTLTFYGLATGTVILLNYASPSGPCTPGLGVVSFFFLLLTALALLTKNLYLTWKNGRQNLPVALIHSIAIALLFAFFW